MPTVRIKGVVLPPRKRVEIGLTRIYGIGRSRARKVLDEAGVNPDLRVAELSPEQVKSISAAVDQLGPLEGELRRQVLLNIKRLKDIECYRGIRHVKGLPVRGQRTRTNSRTVRGHVRRTAGSGKRPPPQKT